LIVSVLPTHLSVQRLCV